MTRELAEAAGRFPPNDLLAKGTNCPMLVIDGGQDVHVPVTDTTIFDGRADTDVQLIAGGTHCAIDKIDELTAVSTRRLATALH